MTQRAMSDGILAASGFFGIRTKSFTHGGAMKVTFLEGMEPGTGGFGVKLEEVPLTREPKQDTIGSSRVASGKVVASPRLNGA